MTSKQQQGQLAQHTKKDIRSLFVNIQVSKLLISQIQQIHASCLSIIVIYQKVFIKLTHPTQSLFMLKITKSFPLPSSVKLYLLDGQYQPKVFDTRDFVGEALGREWQLQDTLKDVLNGVKRIQKLLNQRNQDYLAMQNTANFVLKDVFIYNQLEEHSSLELFVDRSKQTTNTLIGLSQTHFLTFKKVAKKFKSKQQQVQQSKSKTLYGKKFMLTRYCDLQCISQLSITKQSNQINLTLQKPSPLKSSPQFQLVNRKYQFPQQKLSLFLRIILKSISKFQPTQIQFNPSFNENQSITSKIVQLNEMQEKLEKIKDSKDREGMVASLNRNYQKIIQFYSARANPYYLIYVNKLNYLYSKYFVNKHHNIHTQQNINNNIHTQQKMNN